MSDPTDLTKDLLPEPETAPAALPEPDTAPATDTEAEPETDTDDGEEEEDDDLVVCSPSDGSELELDFDPDFANIDITHKHERTRRTRARCILTFFEQSYFAKHSECKGIEEVVEKFDIDSLRDMNEYLFRALLARDFGQELCQAYCERRLSWMMYRKLLRYYRYYCDHEILNIVDETVLAEAQRLRAEGGHPNTAPLQPTAGSFRLPGRRELERFFNRSVVDIVNHYETYSALGIRFPKHFILEGAPGCGKTYAVEALAKHLGWYTVRITSGNVGSSLVHETPKLLEEKFAEAASHAPAIVIMDEMESFTPPRDSEKGRHSAHVEEVGALLRCIQAAAEQQVLVVGMTNHIGSIDPALLRTGRLGTHLHVDMPCAEEVEAVLHHELARRPHAEFTLQRFAAHLLHRPLSDITHVVDEAALCAAQRGSRRIEESDLAAALREFTACFSSPTPRTIGFTA